MRRHELTLSGMTLIGALVGGGVLLGIFGDHIDGSPVDASNRPVAVETDSGVVILDRLALDTLDVGRPEGPYDWERIAKERGQKYRACHVQLVRHQERLRRLGHHWNGERWVRSGVGR